MSSFWKSAVKKNDWRTAALEDDVAATEGGGVSEEFQKLQSEV